MKQLIFLLVFPVAGFGVKAQEKEADYGIKFSGFIKNDILFDTRQTVAIREGHFLLWPMGESPDANGKDINAHPSFNMLAIQSRLTGNITGPDAFGAKTSGVLEGAFFGTSDADVNGFRLRHAYGKLTWDRAELLFGQTWHPMFIPGCFPDVVSFNTGAPFQPFARNPQIRFTWFLGDLAISGTLLTQRDFTSAGGSSLLRNSGLPEYNLHLFWSNKESADSEILAGINAGYKTLVPRLVTNFNEVANEKVNSFIQEAYVKIKIPALTFKFEAVYGQNTYDICGISSYALISQHPITDLREYAPLTSISTWSEIQTNGKVVQFGLFAGYTKNLGTTGYQEVHSTTFGIRSDIDYVYRIAPRIILNSGKVRFATEVEYTAAAFGTYNVTGAVSDSREVANFRLLIGAYYFF